MQKGSTILLRSLAISSLLVTLWSCSDMKSRQEVADKLKPILVLVNPPSGAEVPEVPLNPGEWQAPRPGEEVTLQFHFIGPEASESPRLSVGELTPEVLKLPLTDWVIESPAKHDYPGLRHFTIQAKAILPTAEQISARIPGFASSGSVRMNYTLNAEGGGRSLPIVGDFVVYRDQQVTGVGNQLFGSTIDGPAPDQAISKSKISISASLKNPQAEPVKVGWYASAGEIKNRRAATTEWELPGPGVYTLVLTVRGKQTRNGDIQIRRVTQL